ncbi:MAG: Na(+)-translocating NADH-quinone reductase subunit A [Melioribacteraceae bacterium]|jgi:Na+-transporting NADH:ubiquinone oxidoreductase subunit A|nr:Na(+)-translocating NADH-quinone reductase subunit A [Melioribacteraceae bacterium]
MAKVKIKKGLNLPLNGSPKQEISKTILTKKVALLGDDYVGMKPTMLVAVGDEVKKGQFLFADKKTPGVKFTATASGKIIEINRGEKRAFKSMVIEKYGSEEITFKSYSENELSNLTADSIKENLIESGLWTSLRVRPFSKVADPSTTPNSIFVTAMDTNPLAPSIEKVLEGKEKAFENGLKVLDKLIEGKIFLCKAPNSKISIIDSSKLIVEEFEGPHPSGLVGTHIHFLDPVSSSKNVWYVNAQDVAAIGNLFTTGKIDTDRIISVGGSQVKLPTLIKTEIGADLNELTTDALKDGENRVISGSVFTGHHATGFVSYLGRYHQQVSVIEEESKREFLGWVNPFGNRFSIKSVVMPKKVLNFSTSLHGGKRSIVPVGSYEAVMPLDILPNYLLRALAVNDIEEAEQLGCLELDEEDLGLCSFVCPSKINHGENLRSNLTQIEKEG